ncbi:helix-turn-helix domain-containing protein [Dyadobacter luticola]|uniref:AraC family transcriptional regulator n=1 Tax=Dyadobacter luticola TaxID=1979387 RepID=A0A5R9L4T8_9BACT|nr:helix-turn-helix domain-containing protein [Dyadobacter luticola]TLV03421.1 AraC family transcriptional regulator [Dyadobacter luticola]
MLHQEFDSPETLRDTIKCFWYDKRETGDSGAEFDVMPDGSAEIIFYFGVLYSKSYYAGQQPLPSPFIMGLLNEPAAFYTKNTLEIISVRCFPWTVFDLLNLPSGNDRVRFFEHPIAQLQATLQDLVNVQKIDGAVNVLQEYFLNVRAEVAVDRQMLSKAGTAMQEANGTKPVSEVAAAAHATVRTLERNFKQSSGHTVKDVSALIRFEQVRNQLWIDPDANIAGLAYEFGYTDQSHLSREFKKFSGTTPAAFARKARKSRRVFSSDFVAFVQS